MKFYLIIKTQLSRKSTDGEEQLMTPYFCSVPKIILQSSDIGEEVDIVGDRIKDLLATHEFQGSGFKLDLILDCRLQVASYDRIGGSLPKYVQGKQATINIKNETRTVLVLHAVCQDAAGRSPKSCMSLQETSQ